MGKKAELAKMIAQHSEGLRVQWQDIAGQTDPEQIQMKRAGASQTHEDIGRMMKEYYDMDDDA